MADQKSDTETEWATSIKSEPYYGGSLDQAKAEAMLKEDGDFMVRSDENGKVGIISPPILTIMNDGAIKHLPVEMINNKYTISDKDEVERQFVTLKDLIGFYKTDKSGDNPLRLNKGVVQTSVDAAADEPGSEVDEDEPVTAKMQDSSPPVDVPKQENVASETASVMTCVDQEPEENTEPSDQKPKTATDKTDADKPSAEPLSPDESATQPQVINATNNNETKVNNADTTLTATLLHISNFYITPPPTKSTKSATTASAPPAKDAKDPKTTPDKATKNKKDKPKDTKKAAETPSKPPIKNGKTPLKVDAGRSDPKQNAVTDKTCKSSTSLGPEKSAGSDKSNPECNKPEQPAKTSIKSRKESALRLDATSSRMPVVVGSNQKPKQKSTSMYGPPPQAKTQAGTSCFQSVVQPQTPNGTQTSSSRGSYQKPKRAGRYRRKGPQVRGKRRSESSGTTIYGSVQPGAKKQERIEDQEWYHGLLPRDHITIMLKHQGDFLVRQTEVNGQQKYVISIMWDNQANHVVIYPMESGGFRINPSSTAPKDIFASVPDLVQYYFTKNEPLPLKSYILMNPIPRQAWELSHEQIQLEKKLGEGAFGEVFMGTLTLQGGNTVKVAVKRSHVSKVLTKDQIREMVAESRLMQKLQHTNIVKFYGIAAQQQPVMIVMELVDGGGLDSYLKKNGRNVPMVQRVSYCLGSAAGCGYLHSCGNLHRDIACRNMLITGQQVVKVSDFGLATEGNKFTMDAKSKVPIRWLAPETLENLVYTQKTDIWSYGILCWEVFNDAQEPYPGKSPKEVASFVRHKQVMDLDKSKPMPPKMKELIQKCWSINPDNRPNFDDIQTKLKSLEKQLQRI